MIGRHCLVAREIRILGTAQVDAASTIDFIRCLLGSVVDLDLNFVSASPNSKLSTKSTTHVRQRVPLGLECAGVAPVLDKGCDESVAKATPGAGAWSQPLDTAGVRGRSP